MHATFKRAWGYEVPGRKGVRRELPAGWAGELPDEIAAAAESAGAAVLDRPKPEPKARAKAKADAEAERQRSLLDRQQG